MPSNKNPNIRNGSGNPVLPQNPAVSPHIESRGFTHTSSSVSYVDTLNNFSSSNYVQNVLDEAGQRISDLEVLVPPTIPAYGKTVFVAQGHTNATDTRTGLDLFSFDYPFETISAAISAISLAAETDVTVLVSSGTYDETVSTLPSVKIKGEGENTIISRVSSSGSGTAYLEDLRIINSPATTGPNTYCLSVNTSTITVIAKNVSFEHTKDSNSGNNGAVILSSGNLILENCAVISDYAHASASTGYGAIYVSGSSTVDIKLYNSKLSCTVDIPANQSLGAIYSEQSGGGTSNIFSVNTTFSTVQENISSAATRFGSIVNSNAASTSSYEGINCKHYLNCASTAGVNFIVFVARNNASSTWKISNPIIEPVFGGTAYIAELPSASTTVRVLDAKYPTISTKLDGFSVGGTLVHTGVLSDGTYFPISSVYGKTVWVSQGHERATDTRTGLDLFDRENPFETINAACTAITSALEENVVIRISAGFYNEVVTAPNLCTFMGEGRDLTFIAQVLCSTVTAYFENVSIHNSSSIYPSPVTSPEFSSVVIFGGSARFNNCGLYLNKDDSTFGDQSVVSIVGDCDLKLYNCKIQLSAFTLTASGILSCIRSSSVTASCLIEIDNCDLYTLESSTTGQNVCVLDTDSTTGTTTFVTRSSNLRVLKSNILSTLGSIYLTNNRNSAGKYYHILENSQLSLIGASGSTECAAFKLIGESYFYSNNCTLHVAGVGGVKYITEEDSNTVEVRILNLSQDMGYVLERSGTPTTLDFSYQGTLITGQIFPFTSVYSKDIWVAKSHERATDTRTGLSPFDKEHPFQTITAAMSAISALTPDDYVLHVGSGVYNEDTGVPDTNLQIIGEGDSTQITRLVINFSNEYSFKNIKISSTASGVAANASPLRINTTTTLNLDNCYLNFEKNSTALALGTIEILNCEPEITIKNSKLRFYGSHAGTTGVTYGNIWWQSSGSPGGQINIRDSSTEITMVGSTTQPVAFANLNLASGSSENIIAENNHIEVTQSDGSYVGEIYLAYSSSDAWLLFSNNRVVFNKISGNVLIFATLGIHLIYAFSNVFEFYNNLDNYISTDDNVNSQFKLTNNVYAQVSTIPSRLTSVTSNFLHQGTLSQSGYVFPNSEIKIPITLYSEQDVLATPSTTFSNAIAFDPTKYFYENVEIKFCIILSTLGSISSSNISLYNTSDSETIAGSLITSFSGTPTIYKSSVLTTANSANNIKLSEKIYQIQSSASGGGSPQTIRLHSAWLEIRTVTP